MVAAWTGSMKTPRVSAVAKAFLCPSLQTAEDYERQIEHAGLTIRSSNEITGLVVRTWEICLERTAKVRVFNRILPREIRTFVDGMTTILDAYRSRALTYSVIVAEK